MSCQQQLPLLKYTQPQKKQPVTAERIWLPTPIQAVNGQAPPPPAPMHARKMHPEHSTSISAYWGPPAVTKKVTKRTKWPFFVTAGDKKWPFFVTVARKKFKLRHLTTGFFKKSPQNCKTSALKTLFFQSHKNGPACLCS